MFLTIFLTAMIRPWTQWISMWPWNPSRWFFNNSCNRSWSLDFNFLSPFFQFSDPKRTRRKHALQSVTSLKGFVTFVTVCYTLQSVTCNAL
jgi:hypothetical protein